MREFGKYSIIGLIGSGGMAEVFLAKSHGAEGLEKRLVIKRILPEFAKRPKFVSMFIDEAKVAVSLNHPNIVQVYEFGKVASDYYLAMEYVDGTDLGHALTALTDAKRHLAPGDAAYIGIEVAKALDYAHRKTDEYGRALSIVHRDVSPQNILVTWDGSVKLVDFGIAKARHTADERLGVVKGKMSYMAPEQALGEKVDHRADVFSLGAVLYELLTGRAPFPRGKPEEIIEIVRTGKITPITTLVPDLPKDLATAIMSAIARDPDARIASARAFQVELTHYLFSLGQIHDAASVADTLTELRPALSRPGVEERSISREPTIATAEDFVTRGHHTLAEDRGVTPDGATPSTGTPLPYSVAHFRERRESAIISGELLGLADLRGSLPEERWRSILFDYIRLVQAVAYKSECAVDRVEERGFVLISGIPVASDNDAEAAVRVASDLVEAIDALNVNLKSPLRLSVGIGAGSLILERSRTGDEGRYSWVAEEPTWDLSRRLAKEALAGEILVDDTIFRRTRRLYTFSHVTDIEETGSTQPVHRLEGRKSKRQLLRERKQSFTTLHGRDLQRRLLRQCFQEVERKETLRTVILLGEPGVGKASIIDEFLAGLPEDRVNIVRATCSADFRDRPFAPIVDMLEELLGIEMTPDVRQLKRQIEAKITAALPDYEPAELRYVLHAVGLLFGIKYPDNLIESLESDRRRARMFLSLRRLLGVAPSRRATVFVVHDVHWSDQSSLEFLADVVHERRKRPVMLALTARANADLLENRHWQELIKGRHVVVEKVDDLPPRAARSLIADLGEAPLDPTLIERIVDQSGGNPLFIKEILEHFQEEDRLVERDGLLTLRPDSQGTDLPATVEGIVAGRINALPPGPRSLLLHAAVIGREMGDAELRALSGVLPTEDLDVLVQRGILVRLDEGQAGSRYRIKKRLTHEVALRSLVDTERREVNTKIAEYLIHKNDDPARCDNAAVGRHLHAAGKSEEAAQYFLFAANDATTTSSLIEALSLVDRALNILPDSSDVRFSVLKNKEKLLTELGRSQQRAQVLEELRDFVDHHGPPEHEIYVLIRIGRYRYDLGQMDEAEAALREAHELASKADDQAAGGHALALLSNVLRDTGRDREARDACAEALQIYQNVDDPDGAALAWNSHGILLHQAGELEQALAAYERVVELARRAGSRPLEERARINIGFCLVKMGDLEKAVETYRSALREILQLGQRSNEAALLANLGHAQQLLGDFSRAEHSLKRSVRLSRRNSDTMRLADGLLTLAQGYFLRGRLEEAEKTYKAGLKAALEANNHYLLSHAYLLSAELRLKRNHDGDLDAALADVAQIQALGGENSHLFARAGAESLRARVLMRMGKDEEALAASYRALALVNAATHVEGTEDVLYHHAILLERFDRLDEAREAARRAHALVDGKRSRITTSILEQSFLEVRTNRRVMELYQRLCRPNLPPGKA